jgi:hypothetical protein
MGTSHTSPAKPNYRGLDLEKTSRLRSRQIFFLDIPFDRTSLTPWYSTNSLPSVLPAGSIGATDPPCDHIGVEEHALPWLDNNS